MININVITEAIGFVWPVIFTFALIMAAIFVFSILIRFSSRESLLEDETFMRRMIKGVETLASLAVLTGMIGTAKGLIDAMPELRHVLLQNGDSTQAMGNVIESLTNVFASTLAGLVVAALGEVNALLLRFKLDDIQPKDLDFPEPKREGQTRENGKSSITKNSAIPVEVDILEWEVEE